MSLASKTYYKIANEIEAEMDAEQDVNKKKELRKVAAQNYFYSAMEAIEWKLKQAGIDLYSINSHEQRLNAVRKNSSQFKELASLGLKFEIMINYDYRRKVAYKGENGNKFLILKELAELCQNEIK